METIELKKGKFCRQGWLKRTGEKLENRKSNFYARPMNASIEIFILQFEREGKEVGKSQVIWKAMA